jgi:glycosyltransferase involved in cell wall biosynthesis
MMIKNKKILFVSHAADRTGAPLFLLRFLQWLKIRHGASFEILLKRTGPLGQEFMKVGRTYCWDVNNSLVRYLDQNGMWGRNRGNVLKWTGANPLHRLRLIRALKRRRYDLVFINSLASCELVPSLARALDCPIVCRAAEFRFAVESYCGEEKVREALPYIERFVAVSDIIANMLSDNFNVARKKISKIPGVQNSPPNLPEKGQLRKALGLPEDAFVIYGCGPTTWIKGTDIFLQIAATITRRARSNVRFIWVGGSPNVQTEREILFDIQKLELSEVFTLTGPLEDPWPVYGAADLFALTSREDSFPQAALEAASLGLPIICFRGATGSEEFVNENTGSVVGYLDTEAFAEAVLGFMSDNDRYQQASESVKRVAQEYHLERIGPKLVKLLNELL